MTDWLSECEREHCKHLSREAGAALSRLHKHNAEAPLLPMALKGWEETSQWLEARYGPEARERYESGEDQVAGSNRLNFAKIGRASGKSEALAELSGFFARASQELQWQKAKIWHGFKIANCDYLLPCHRKFLSGFIKRVKALKIQFAMRHNVPTHPLPIDTKTKPADLSKQTLPEVTQTRA